jgi:NAD(P)-dependent dehydrogenase (short-subunit alcohol dehydrogenase family)
MPRRGEHSFLRPDATYVLVGGSGGLGNAEALWMASHGAKHLILASRSGDSKEEVKALLETLRGQSVNIFALRCDVSKYSEVENLVSFAKDNMPPIRGLIHGGMVLRVGLQFVVH